MIVVDTSALLAIALDEPQAEVCSHYLAEQHEVLVSAGTLTEALVVASFRNVSLALNGLIESLPHSIIPVTEAAARRAGAAYQKWGKGIHPAGLNFGDCFAYELAKERNCPLLFIGNDFSETDIKSALEVGERSR